jgi:hypothetical protein
MDEQFDLDTPRSSYEKAVAQWRDEIAELERRRAQQVEMRVLVWGPAITPPHPDRLKAALQDKRRKIITELVEVGITAITSEDLTNEGAGGEQANPYHYTESLQAETADLIILLLASPGSIGELSSVLQSRKAARRSVVFVDETAAVGGFVIGGPLSVIASVGLLHRYTEKELWECSVARAAVDYALDAARSLRGTHA